MSLNIATYELLFDWSFAKRLCLSVKSLLLLSNIFIFGGDKIVAYMKSIEKRDYIHSHLHEVEEPTINEIYSKMVSIINESLINESEDDINNGNLTSHAAFKQEVQTWRPTK